MNRRATICLLMIAFTTTGCLDPRFTRLPTIYPQHPVAANQAIQRFDPFPDPNIGGEMSVRPRAYLTPRTESRQAAEQRMLNGLRAAPESIPPYYPPSASRYSDAVH